METELHEVCCPNQNCGVTFWVTKTFDHRRREDGRDFFCPNGHSITYGKTGTIPALRAESQRYEGLYQEEKRLTKSLRKKVRSLEKPPKKKPKKKPV